MFQTMSTSFRGSKLEDSFVTQRDHGIKCLETALKMQRDGTSRQQGHCLRSQGVFVWWSRLLMTSGAGLFMSTYSLHRSAAKQTFLAIWMNGPWRAAQFQSQSLPR